MSIKKRDLPRSQAALGRAKGAEAMLRTVRSVHGTKAKMFLPEQPFSRQGSSYKNLARSQTCGGPPQFCRHLASCLAHPASLHHGESQIIPIAAAVTCLQLVAAGLEDRAL